MPWGIDMGKKRGVEAKYASLPTTEQEGAQKSIQLPKSSHWYSNRNLRFPFYIACAACFILAVDFLALRNSSSRRITEPLGAYHAVLNHFFPVGDPDRTDDWQNENSKSLHALLDCVERGTCGQNQTSVILLASFHFAGSIRGSVSGEDIWAASIIVAAKELGYTYIYTETTEQLARTYRMFPDLVKVVMMQASDAHACFKDSKCTKSAKNPLGVPVWKTLSFHFWRGPEHPLGAPWTLSPEDWGRMYPNDKTEANLYLGYSVEQTCRSIDTIPAGDRPNQAYVYAKSLSYFYDDSFAWPNVPFAPPFDLELVAGINNNTKFPSSFPAGVNNLGPLNKTRFYHEIAKSRVVIGVGKPPLSPTPYDALCMGVPFINPILDWKKDDPDDRSRWRTQHEGLKFEKPPYVYHVQKGDGEGLWNAVRQAIDNPIDRYIIPSMTMEALKFRLGQIVEKDWKGHAEALLDNRKTNGEKLFEV